MNKILCWALLSSLALSGCTALLWHKDPIRGVEVERATVAEDAILTFATLTQSPTDEATPPLLLLGTHHTYALEEGALDLRQVLTSALNNGRLGLNPYQKLAFRLDSSSTFSGSIMLHYQEPDGGYTQQEQALLDQLAFKYNAHNKYAYKNIALNGHIQEASPLAERLQQNKQFRAPYSVSFYTETHAKTFNAGKLVGKIIATPFTLVGDLVLIPIGVVAVGIGAGLSR